MFPTPFVHGILAVSLIAEPMNTVTPESPWLAIPMRTLSDLTKVTALLRDTTGGAVTGSRRALYIVTGW